ncbi:DUF7079 family protein [Hyphococcus luteus]|uniref:DUF7079 family protein n=1 Tax=Hyphococcus luteus TaxID=2058213 RepID=UPI00105750A8|nr:hypothetical protein [Marinicaulis flavus]
MLPPGEDLKDRQPVWDYLQYFWMDTDPEILFPRIVNICANSKYSLDEIEQIFWNELEPAVGFNLWGIAGEWAGFEIDWLSERILKKNRFGRPLPLRQLRPHASHWWGRLKSAVSARRDSEHAGSVA